MHCVQYGRMRSHFVARALHVKQSSIAPPERCRLFLFRGAETVVTLLSINHCSFGEIIEDVILAPKNIVQIDISNHLHP